MELSLASTTSPRVPTSATVLVPIGATEQHGPHLPLDTDTQIAQAVAEAAARKLRKRRQRVVVAPAICYGSSGEHQAFAGTISIGTPVLTSMLVEITRSVATWARQVVFVNGHGGNLEALHAAMTQLSDEGHDVMWLPCAVPGADLHAGRTETSLMLHLRRRDVRPERAEVGNTAALVDLFPLMAEHGVRAVSANGVLGDPRGATAEEGHALLEMMADRVADRVLSARAVETR